MLIADYNRKMVILILLTGMIDFLKAQPQPTSLENMWNIALRHNLEIKNAVLLVEKSDRLKKSSWEIEPTSLSLEHGQINSEAQDNFYRVEQDLGSPFEFSAHRKYYQREKELYVKRQVKIQREVKMELRRYYYKWLNEDQKQQELTRGIELFQKASEYSAIQYETGESNLLSKTMITSKLQELILEQSRIIVNKRAIQNALITLLNTDENIIPSQDEQQKLVFNPDPDIEYLNPDSIPEVAEEYHKLLVARAYHGITKAALGPTLKAGYFNQAIDNVSGFQGWVVGVDIPIWFLPQKSRIQAAALGSSIAENNYLYEKSRMGNELNSKIVLLEQYEDNLEYYENQQLENARMIEENANLLYESGDIGYLEYVQNMTSSLEIRKAYWDLLNEYNQIVIELYYYVDL